MVVEPEFQPVAVRLLERHPPAHIHGGPEHGDPEQQLDEDVEADAPATPATAAFAAATSEARGAAAEPLRRRRRRARRQRRGGGDR